jgi:aminopeptidase N
MKRNASIGTIFVLLAALAGLLAYAAAPDITGTWIGKTEVPNAGVDELTLVIKKTATGFTGTFSDTLAQVEKDAAITAVKLEGDDLTFNFSLVDGTAMQAKLKVDGDKLAGTWGHPQGDVGTMTFERKK